MKKQVAGKENKVRIMSTSEKLPELQLSFTEHLQHCQEHYYQIKHLE
jgi:hypothetical protein